MAPEQFFGKADALSDVYALGAIAYRGLTGNPPRRAPDKYTSYREMAELRPVPLRELVPRIDADLESICAVCLQNEPHQRLYTSASELHQDLERYLSGVPVRARPRSYDGNDPLETASRESVDRRQLAELRSQARVRLAECNQIIRTMEELGFAKSLPRNKALRVLRQAAKAQFVLADFNRGAECIRAILQIGPTDPECWYEAACCYGFIARVHESFNLAEMTKEERATVVRYTVVARKLAIDALTMAVQHGFADPKKMGSEPDFKSLTDDEGFGVLLDQIGHRAASSL